VFDWTVPGYRGIRELGHGAPGRTVAGVHEASGLPVTIRYLPSDPALAGYRADARVLAGLRSPHVAPVYEHVETDHGAATIREYVEGASVRQLAGSGLRPESALALLQAGLLGLAAAHAEGVRHRRYRPENLLVDQHGAARVTDFALAARAGASDEGPTDGGPTDEVAADGVPEATGASAWIMEAEAARDDVRAAYATFLTCLTGREPEPTDLFAPGRLPKRLRALAEPAAAGDGAALLTAVAAAGRAVSRDWAKRAVSDLASRVAKARPRRER
jgi:serine/threonine-protein kinase